MTTAAAPRPEPASDPEPQTVKEQLAAIKAHLREFHEKERARRVRTGTLRPRTHAEITAYLDALDERDTRAHRRADHRTQKTAQPPTGSHNRPAQP